MQVNLYVDITLPYSAENQGLFQLRSTLKSDAGAVIHTAHRPLALPYRSRLVSALRDLVLFPFYLTGIVPETTTLRQAVAENLVETPAAPLAAAEVVVSGARPMHVPPVIHSGKISVNVQLSALPTWRHAAPRCPTLSHTSMPGPMPIHNQLQSTKTVSGGGKGSVFTLGASWSGHATWHRTCMWHIPQLSPRLGWRQHVLFLPSPSCPAAMLTAPPWQRGARNRRTYMHEPTGMNPHA